ncbi:MAG: BMP family ABC transporter substrate-binding protein [Clostridiales bacterium]|nr:BMP family ABC transporter substrate-binding protein [Clostridiales bacterium]
MKNKIVTILLTLVMITALVSGCSKKQNNNNTDDGNDLPKVAVLLNGNLGDKSFFDSANNGATLMREELGLDVNVVEMGFDNTIWETTLYETSDKDYDIIIVGTYQMQEILQKVAPEYPEKKYIIFDSAVNYDLGGLDNVYSILFKQNEGAYLAGVLAAMVSENDTMEYSLGNKIIGVVGGMDIPVINDFIAGYIKGAVDTVEDIKVSTSYIGDFNDTAKAKDLAKAQIRLGADVVFHVAAQAGLGVIEGTADEGKYAIGVDADQALALKDTQENRAKMILTSVVKNIDQVILQAVKEDMNGTLQYGQTQSMGIKENAIDIAENEFYEAMATDDMKARIDEIREQIKSGELNVPSIFNMADGEFSELVSSVAP